MYDRRNYVGKYSAEEVEQLKSLKEKHGNDWATIGAAMGRSASSVKDRFRLMRDHCHSGLSLDIASLSNKGVTLFIMLPVQKHHTNIVVDVLFMYTATA